MIHQGMLVRYRLDQVRTGYMGRLVTPVVLDDEETTPGAPLDEELSGMPTQRGAGDYLAEALLLSLFSTLDSGSRQRKAEPRTEANCSLPIEPQFGSEKLHASTG